MDVIGDYWRTGGGVKVYIPSMETGHIENCINLIINKRINDPFNMGDLYIKRFKRELKLRRTKLYETLYT